MSPGADHLREAEYLLDLADSAHHRGEASNAAFYLAKANTHLRAAQVHATALQSSTGRLWASVLGVGNDGSAPT